jgi:outer membrane lipoprotein-sorting protein
MRSSVRGSGRCRPQSRSFAVAVSLALLGAIAFPTRGHAQNPPANGDQVIAAMKAALEPDKPSVRRMDMTVAQDSEQRHFTLVQARKHLPDGMRSITVLLAPDDAKGLAYLVAEKKPGQKDNTQWLYIPVVRRIREMVPAENYMSFLDSDFTYADLGFVDRTTTNKLLGTETVDGKKAYKVQSIPGQTTKDWYFSKINTWVDAETLLPIKREFVSPAGNTFKVETYEGVSRFDGVPTALKTTMRNLPAKTWTELKITEVSYGLDIPDEVFDQTKLRTIADLAFWNEKQPAAKPVP